MPYMMMPEDHKIVADVLYRILTKPPKFDDPVVPGGAPSNLSGIWQVQIDHALGSASHRFLVEQSGNVLRGVHNGETVSGDLSGSVHANQIKISSVHHIEGTEIEYSFSGTAEGDTLQGTLLMREYGAAAWKASRHAYAT